MTWSDSITKYLSSNEEAEIYKKAKLKEAKIGGRPALIRTDIDWSDYSCRRNVWLKREHPDFYEWAKDYNNADLIGEGYAPLDHHGDQIELHHIGQHSDSPFSELTCYEHRSEGNFSILHPNGDESEINRYRFKTEKSDYWQARFKAFSKEELAKIYGK